jgi:osmotically-inducible protein OsmY
MRIKFMTALSLAAVVFFSACGKSDADMQKAVQDKLTADGVSGVTVAVNGGVAILSGEVADSTVRDRAEASARAVEGITSVTNNLETKPLPTPAPPPLDPALSGKVEENLKKAGCTGATVEVMNGRITITGTVPAAKYTECIQVVNESGATGFDNRLERAN